VGSAKKRKKGGPFGKIRTPWKMQGEGKIGLSHKESRFRGGEFQKEAQKNECTQNRAEPEKKR